MRLMKRHTSEKQQGGLERQESLVDEVWLVPESLRGRGGQQCGRLRCSVTIIMYAA